MTALRTSDRLVSRWQPRGSTANRVVELRRLSGVRRQLLAGTWLEEAAAARAIAAMHAGLTRELRALGAPQALCRASHWAVADGAAHAARCQALAAAYAGRDLLAEPPDGGPAASADVRAMVLRVVHDGCIGRTVSANVAAAAAERCEDPAVRAILQRAAADANRHAGIAWRIVRWALRTQPDPGLAAAVAAAFAATTPAPKKAARGERALERHGHLGPAARAAITARTLREVVRPCAAALLERLRHTRAS
jgi:hypothetical protein